MKKIFFSISIAVWFSACTISTHFIQDGSAAKPAVSPESIKIYSGDISQDYEVIGSVAVDVNGDGKLAAVALKEKAGKIGANAVIMVKLTKLVSYTSRTGLSGVAVFIK